MANFYYYYFSIIIYQEFIVERITTMEDQIVTKPQQYLWYGDRKKDTISIQQWIESVQNEKGKTGPSLSLFCKRVLATLPKQTKSNQTQAQPKCNILDYPSQA